MKLAEIVKWLQGDDISLLGKAARAVGHTLPRRDLAELSDLRSAIASIPATGGEYAAGYRQAVRDLCAAYEAALEPQLELDAHERAVRSRPSLAVILKTLTGGARRPSEIATSVSLDVSAVSRALAELRDLGLVEHAARGESEDGRSRPHRLTFTGDRLVQRLGEAPPLARTVVHAVSRMFAELLTVRRLTHGALLRLATPILGADVPATAMVDEVVSSAKALGLVASVGNVLVATELTAHNRLAEQLDMALRGATPPAVLELSRRITPGVRIVVRSARLKEKWNGVLCRHPALVAANGRTFTREDLDAGDLVGDESVALVYDSLVQLILDELEPHPALLSLRGSAQIKLCFASPTGVVPSTFERIEVADVTPASERVEELALAGSA